MKNTKNYMKNDLKKINKTINTMTKITIPKYIISFFLILFISLPLSALDYEGGASLWWDVWERLS